MKFILFALFASFSFQAAAVTAEECDAQTSNARNYCYQALFIQEDGRMNSYYQTVLVVANGEVRENIITAHNSWVSYRDNDCAARWMLLQIEGNDIAKFACLALKTKARADELEQYIELLEQEPE